MISVLVCSINENVLNDFKTSLLSTIGVEYELLVWDNRKDSKSICWVYNYLAGKAKYDVLCFVHEDVSFLTPDWGIQINRIFVENVKIGIVGVAGSSYKSLAPGGWYNSNDNFNYNSGIAKAGQKDTDVVVVDGVFICTKRIIWEKYKFDENTFTHFHCYDLDICLSILKEYRIVVTCAVQLNHLSGGNFNEFWVSSSLIFAEKWKKHLPVTTENVPRRAQKKMEWVGKITFIKLMIKTGFSLRDIFKVYFSYGFFRFFSINYSVKGLLIILKNYGTKR